MKTVNLAQAKASLADCARQAAQEPVVVTSRGRPVAALVPIENADLETVALSTNADFVALIERSRVRQSREGSVTADEMRRRIAARVKTRRARHAKP